MICIFDLSGLDVKFVWKQTTIDAPPNGPRAEMSGETLPTTRLANAGIRKSKLMHDHASRFAYRYRIICKISLFLDTYTRVVDKKSIDLYIDLHNLRSHLLHEDLRR